MGDVLGGLEVWGGLVQGAWLRGVVGASKKHWAHAFWNG